MVIVKLAPRSEFALIPVAISEMMIFANLATKAKKLPVAWFEAFVGILSPFAPHLAEELWQRLGHTESITYAAWPQYEEAKLAVVTITVAVQVNGKMRGTVELPADVSKDDAIAAAKQQPNAARFLEGKTLRREIYVPCYRYVLEHHLGDQLDELRRLLTEQPVVLLDYETNQDIDDLSRPLSHASLIARYLAGQL